jgi:hypothetical protein
MEGAPKSRNGVVRGQAPTIPQCPGTAGGEGGRTLYESLQKEPVARAVLTSHKRVGFYRLRGQLGAGSFSKVKFGVHLLTNGEFDSSRMKFLCILAKIQSADCGLIETSASFIQQVAYDRLLGSPPLNNQSAISSRISH